MIQVLLSGILLLSFAAPAMAETKIGSGSKSPNKQRCVTHHEIGTRLAKKRVCMTEAKWRALETQNRIDIDQAVNQKQWQCGFQKTGC
jgi:hypothetical protein